VHSFGTRFDVSNDNTRHLSERRVGRRAKAKGPRRIGKPLYKPRNSVPRAASLDLYAANSQLEWARGTPRPHPISGGTLGRWGRRHRLRAHLHAASTD
jgi:hypothetical protein